MALLDIFRGKPSDRRSPEAAPARTEVAVRAVEADPAHRWLLSLPTLGSDHDDQSVKELYSTWQKIGLSPNTTLIPKRGETVLGQRLGVTHSRIRQQQVRTGGGTMGFSVKLAKGVWAHPHVRTPVSYRTKTVVQTDDKGSLFLTDRRLYFSGSARNIEIRFDKLDLLPRWTNEGYLMVGVAAHDELFRVGDRKAAQAWVALLSQLVVKAAS